MTRILWLLRVRLLEIEADGGVPGARARLAVVRAGYCATFPPHGRGWRLSGPGTARRSRRAFDLSGGNSYGSNQTEFLETPDPLG
jgi:hypothetical protein